MAIVAKFGGSSMSCADSLKMVKKIVFDSEQRQYIVVSAPGKLHRGDTKVTDLLLRCVAELKIYNACPSLSRVESIFINIVNDLQIDIDINKLLSDTRQQIFANPTTDFVISRGEYLSAKVFASFCKLPFVDGADLIVFDDSGCCDIDKTLLKATTRLSGCGRCVISGFYGATVDGAIKTFSRGGADISGAIIAKVVNADMYENWTDVNGLLSADPTIVNSPQKIDCLSFRQLRQMSYLGASVLHAESVFPLISSCIPINIKNTFNPNNQGTMITSSNTLSTLGGAVIGVVGKKDFSIVKLEKNQLSDQIDSFVSVVALLKRFQISCEHILIGVDCMSLVVKNVSKDLLLKFLTAIIKDISPDVTQIQSNIGLIAVLGANIVNGGDIIRRLFDALNRASIDIKLIDVGREDSIVIGVDDDCYNRVTNIIYNEFFN